MQKKAFKTIDEYIAIFPYDVQIKLQALRKIIRKVAPNAQETISYQMPTFKYQGNLVHFAAYQNHIGFYPTPSVIVKFKDELKEYKTSKGAIQFKLSKKIPAKLIREIVVFRVNEVEKNIKK